MSNIRPNFIVKRLEKLFLCFCTMLKLLCVRMFVWCVVGGVVQCGSLVCGEVCLCKCNTLQIDFKVSIGV